MRVKRAANYPSYLKTVIGGTPAAEAGCLEASADMRLRSLDGLRGIGSLVVALVHMETSHYLPALPSLEFLSPIVDFFFVLSGFVVALVYANRLTDRTSVFAFLLKRLGRLWPLHVTVLALLVAIEAAKWAAIPLLGFTPEHAPFTGPREITHLLPNLLMLQVFDYRLGLTWNFPSWSISAETWVYLLFVGFCIAGRRPGLGRWRLAAALTLIAGSLLFVRLTSARGMEGTDLAGLARCIAGFLSGMLAHRLWQSHRPALPSGTLAEFAALALLVAFLARFDGFQPLDYLAPVLFAGITLVFASGRGMLSRGLERAPFQALGNMSYSIFLDHAVVVMYVVPRLFRLADHVFTPGSVAEQATVAVAYLVVLIAVAALTRRYVESAGQALFARLAGHLGIEARRPPKMAPAIR